MTARWPEKPLGRGAERPILTRVSTQSAAPEKLAVVPAPVPEAHQPLAEVAPTPETKQPIPTDPLSLFMGLLVYPTLPIIDKATGKAVRDNEGNPVVGRNEQPIMFPIPAIPFLMILQNQLDQNIKALEQQPDNKALQQETAVLRDTLSRLNAMRDPQVLEANVQRAEAQHAEAKAKQVEKEKLEKEELERKRLEEAEKRKTWKGRLDLATTGLTQKVVAFRERLLARVDDYAELVGYPLLFVGGVASILRGVLPAEIPLLHAGLAKTAAVWLYPILATHPLLFSGFLITGSAIFLTKGFIATTKRLREKKKAEAKITTM